MVRESFKDCYVSNVKDVLKIGNHSMERIWDLTGNAPRSIALINKSTGMEWIAESELPTFTKASVVEGALVSYTIDTQAEDGDTGGHLDIAITFSYPSGDIKWNHRIYPNLPILRSYILCHPADQTISHMQESPRDEQQEAEPIEKKAPPIVEVDDYLDYFVIQGHHNRWKSITLMDRTDVHNNLLKEEEGLLYWTEKSYKQGNILMVQNVLAEEGLILIKEGPTPLGYRGKAQGDFYVNGSGIYTLGWGFTPDEIKEHGELTTYGSALVLWRGDEEQALLGLHAYHRAVRPFHPKRDCYIMSNTWGDRSKDGRLSEAFIKKELQAAGRLGIDYCQIDDGWQKGVSANSVVEGGVWEGYYRQTPDFWDVHGERFPCGLAPVKAESDQQGMAFALWFSPDSSNHFENWERDAAILMDLHHRNGAAAFKLDGIKIRSKKGEENLYRMMERVVTSSRSGVFFNLDVTAETRTGYFGRLAFASIFLENRYTDWRNYYPHWTLRNLWMLSKYYPTCRLQGEFLNVDRNSWVYEEDPLSPAVCGIEYAFAVTMAANPLAWMELSGLQEEKAAALAPLIRIYKEHRQAILSGIVLPIGDEPTGTTWSGFQSITNRNEGYLILYKEKSYLNQFSYQLWNAAGVNKMALTCVMGSGCDLTVQLDKKGFIEISMEGSFQFRIYHYQAVW